MANSITTNPWILDTTGATVLWPSRVKINNIEFAGYAVDTDNCLVQDKHGRTVWIGNGSSDLQTVRSGKIGWVDGLILNTLTSGKVYVYIG